MKHLAKLLIFVVCFTFFLKDILAANSNIEIELLLKNSEGSSYTSVRNKLIPTGWVPIRQTDECSWLCSELRSTGLVETEACASTGIAPCRMIFRKGDENLVVHTLGEDRDPSYHSFELLRPSQDSSYVTSTTDVAQNFNGGKTSSKQIQFKSGFEYKFWGRNERCENYEGSSISLPQICVSESEAKQLCESAVGFTVRVRRHASVSYGSAMAEFIREGGDFEDGEIWWENNRCNGSFKIRGFFRGTSTVKTFEGIIGGFILSKDGERILVLSFVPRL
jgi:hypothetical protein